MKNCKWSEGLKHLKISDSGQFLNLCKHIFIKKYSEEMLQYAGLDVPKTDIALNAEIENEDSLYEWDFILFCRLYEQILSLRNKEKTGSFYTPDSIIEYMVKRNLELYLYDSANCPMQQSDLDFEERCFFLDKMQLENLLHCIENIRIIDISCGTGLFLVKCFQKIYSYKKKLYELTGRKIQPLLMKKAILENNLFGIDIQEEPVAITKMALLSSAYEKSDPKAGIPIRPNIFVGNSLIQDVFFSKHFENKLDIKEQPFDIVIGNPPYIGEKGNKALFDRMKETEFGKKYYEGKMDYFYFFIYRALEILKPKGILSYITTNYFVTADGAVKLRNYLKNNASFIEIINFNDYEVFKNAKGQHNLIFSLKKGYDPKQPIFVKQIRKESSNGNRIESVLSSSKQESLSMSQYILSGQEQLYGFKNHILIQENDRYAPILEKIFKNKDHVLGELCTVNQGIVSGADKVTRRMMETKISLETIQREKIKEDEGIFVLEKEEAEKLGLLNADYLKPMYKNSDIQRYRTRENPLKYILYIEDDTFSDFNMLDRRVQNHLKRYREVLEKRRETLQGKRKWYALQWPRKQEMFEGPKIVVPHRAKKNIFAFTAAPWYASADVYFICERSPFVDPRFLLAQLNSKIMYFWLYNRGKRKGEFLELYASPLKELPILFSVDKPIWDEIVSLSEKMISKGEIAALQKKIDFIFYRLYQLTEEEIEVVEKLYAENLLK
ncbi:MAG TPA: N-6 DNA methylase [Clostridiales bacterium]|nr:N-6 DNA methylase [Clostridiales bacterium]